MHIGEGLILELNQSDMMNAVVRRVEDIFKDQGYVLRDKSLKMISPRRQGEGKSIQAFGTKLYVPDPKEDRPFIISNLFGTDVSIDVNKASLSSIQRLIENGWVPDWHSKTQAKFYVTYDHSKGGFAISTAYTNRPIGPVFFSTKKILVLVIVLLEQYPEILNK